MTSAGASGGSDVSEAVVRLTAPAKLTRSLRITGVRADGMHLLEAEMVSISLADELELRPGVSGGTEVVGAWPGAGALAVPAGATNLVARALEAVGRVAAVRLTKHIPAGSGLGGGSSDAAAVLRWAGAGAGPAALSLAASLGADVPFCLIGGRALVSGVGEVITPLPPEPLGLTLLVPPFGVSTAEAYRRWDDLGAPAGPNGNDLEPAARDVEPRLAAWKDRFGELCGSEPRLAGSGSTWFVEAEYPDLQGPLEDRAGGPAAWILCARATYRPDVASGSP